MVFHGTKLILVGTLSIIGLYAAAVLAAVAVIFTLVERMVRLLQENSGRVIAIVGIVLLFLAAYAGTGLWLQKSGRISTISWGGPPTIPLCRTNANRIGYGSDLSPRGPCPAL